METRIIQVFGKVQGVWYRKSTQRKAQELGIVGTVQNLPDGSVQIVASANTTLLNALAQWCHQGPDLAKVTKVTQKKVPFQPFERFEVLR